jgi:hypothetical protein
MVLTFNGQTFSCTKSVKGTDYIKLYDSSGNCTATFSGISDFSGYSYTDDSGTAAEYTEADDTIEQKIANLENVMALYDSALTAEGA